MTTLHDLERLAIAAHERGTTWVAFWPTIADRVRELAPHDRRKFHTIYSHLMHLTLTGSPDGAEPPGTMPWDADDQPSPSDTETQACCLWSPALALPVRSERPR